MNSSDKISYIVYVDRIIVMRGKEKLYGFKVKNVMEGWREHPAKGTKDLLFKTQKEYNG